MDFRHSSVKTRPIWKRDESSRARDHNMTFGQSKKSLDVGTTRSRVSFFMNKFRRLGLIHYNGGIEVHNSSLNVVLHDEPHIET